jgi:biopolymer transport protein ExbD
MNRTFFLIIFCCLLLSCSKNQQIKQNIIIVKVPPVYDEKLSREENYYRFQHFLFPQMEIPNPIPKGLPNDDSVLFISVDENGKLELNSQDAGDVSKTNSLTMWLAEIFREREKNGMYEPGNWKIVKAVGIKTAHSIKYGDFMKVVEAVKQSGAEPIVLLFNDDTKPKVKIVL